MKPDQKGDVLSKAHQEELIRQVIAEPFQEAYRKFVDISTVAKRLEERETLSFTARTVDERWMTMIIVPQGYDKDGKLCTTGKSRHCFLNKEAKPVSLKKENAVLHQKILTFIGKDVQDPDKKQDS